MVVSVIHVSGLRIEKLEASDNFKNYTTNVNMRYSNFIGTLPCNWSSRAISSPTKLLQMNIVNKMKAEARYLLRNILLNI